MIIMNDGFYSVKYLGPYFTLHSVECGRKIRPEGRMAGDKLWFSSQKVGDFTGALPPTPRSLSLYGHQHVIYNYSYTVGDRATGEDRPEHHGGPYGMRRYRQYTPPLILCWWPNAINFGVWGGTPESIYLPTFWEENQILFNYIAIFIHCVYAFFVFAECLE
jgi:hypothetical protein